MKTPIPLAICMLAIALAPATALAQVTRAPAPTHDAAELAKARRQYSLEFQKIKGLAGRW